MARGFDRGLELEFRGQGQVSLAGPAAVPMVCEAGGWRGSGVTDCSGARAKEQVLASGSPHKLRGPFPFGRWELMTTAAAAACEFYQRVFGWQASHDELPDGAAYTHLRTSRGELIGGLYAMAPELAAQAASPHWTPFLLVDDADASLEQAKALGAFVTTASFAFCGRGTMALLQDPSGAPLGLWQAAEAAPVASLNFAWHELSTHDAVAAASFYHDLCGWRLGEDSQGPINYRLFTGGPRLVAAMLALSPRYQGVPSHWLPYVRVAAIEPALAEVRAAGGRVLAPQVAGVLGTQAVVQDPQGAVFGLMAAAVDLQ